MVRVAIITPTLRANWMLERACKSVQANCAHDIEIDHYIVFDNVIANEFNCNSIENYTQIIIEHTGTRGPSAARNAALEVITNRYDYFGYLDSDDALSDNYINSAIQELKDKSCALIFGQGLIVSKEGKKCIFSNIPIRSGELSSKLVFFNVIGCPSGVIIKNNNIINAHKFDDEIRYLEDYFYYLKLLNSGVKFIKIDSHYFYQIHEGQATNDKNISKIDDQFKILFSKLKSMQTSKFAKTIIFIRVKLSYFVLQGKRPISMFLYIAALSFLSPKWFLGRLKMLRK